MTKNSEGEQSKERQQWTTKRNLPVMDNQTKYVSDGQPDKACW